MEELLSCPINPPISLPVPLLLIFILELQLVTLPRDIEPIIPPIVLQFPDAFIIPEAVQLVITLADAPAIPPTLSVPVAVIVPL